MAVFPQDSCTPPELYSEVKQDAISPGVNDDSCIVKLFDDDSGVDSAVSMTTPICTPDGSFEINFEFLQTPSKSTSKSNMDNSTSIDGWDENLNTPQSKISVSPESMCTSPPLKQFRTLSPITSPVLAVGSPRRLEYKLNCLRLFDSPHTPKSIVRKSSLTRLQRPTNKTPYGINSCSRLNMTGSGRPIRKYKSKGTNINPFTPTEIRHKTKWNESSKPNDPVGNDENISLTSSSHKRLALRESNISRYNAEFHEVCKVGSGSFGTVYKCINRLDGCVYAIKKSLKPVAGSADEVSAMREVYAHAVLGSHPHLVRYYSAWAEDDHMIIQNEFCNGGNLSRKIADNAVFDKPFSEADLHTLLKQLAQGLQYIHSVDLVHLDIKPENVFISYPESVTTPLPLCDSIPEDGDVPLPQQGGRGEAVVYKIGDMGHVTSVVDPRVEEGDCRYMARELLQESYLHLPKADIFSLALTIHVSGGGGEPPKNGPYWHSIRDGTLDDLPQCSTKFNNLLKAMVYPDPAERPSASQIVAHSAISPTTEKSKEQLRRELNEEKFKNQVLSRELQAAQQNQKARNKQLVGVRKANRSLSVGNLY